MRNAVHGIIALLLWVVFIRYWQIVMQRPMSEDTRSAIVSLGVLAFLSALYLVGWVWYNIRLASRLQRRQARPVEPERPLRDYMGRWIVIDHPEHFAATNYMEVEVKRILTADATIEEKIFRTHAEAGDINDF